MNEKILLHRRHGTELIYTFSGYGDGRSLTEHLEEELRKHGVVFHPRSEKEILQKILQEEGSRYVRRLVELISRFISNFKVDGYTEMQFSIMKENTYRNAQELIDIAGSFIQKNPSQIVKTLHSDKRIVDPVLIYTFNAAYKRFGADKNTGAYYNMGKAIEAALDHIVEHHGLKQIPGKSTVGKQRKQGGGNAQEGKQSADTPVIKVLLIGRYNYDGYRLEKTELFTYRGKGAGRQLISKKYPFLQITFMTAHASKGLGYDEVIVVNGQGGTYGFPSKIENDPVLSLVLREDRSYTYAEERRVFYVAMTRTKNRVYFIAPQQEPSEFLLELLRDYRSVRLDAFAGENQTAPEQAGNSSDAATTGHVSDAVSKGQKADLSGKNSDVVIKTTKEQERKERFLHDSETGIAMDRKTCPICGYPLQLRYKVSYGLRLYLCTNDVEICGFMTNDLRGGRMSILKCDRCTDGFLTVHIRKKDGSAFLGCTNYTRDGKGCGRTMGWPEYRQKMRYER